MDLSIVIAIIGSVVTIVGAMITLMLWVRGEANSDRRDMVNLVNTERRDIANLIITIKEEMKDFHARLCVIEEKRCK